jgi:hypothetical protein
MSQQNPACYSATRTGAQALRNPSFFTFWLFLAIAFVCSVALAEEPDEKYLKIFYSIQDADVLNKSGKSEQALVKYEKARRDLMVLQKEYPGWSSSTLNYRLNYVGQQIATLQASGAGTVSNAAPRAAENQSPPAGGAGAAQVKLLSPGNEPRKVYRLHPTPSEMQKSVMNLKISMDIKTGEMQMPSVNMPAITVLLDLTPTSIDANGTISYDMVIEDAAVADDPNANAQVAEAMKASFGNVKGLSGKGKMSNRGINLETTMKEPAGADAQMKQALEQMKEILGNSASPLPEEAIGVGARWQSTKSIKSQGMTIQQSSTYELTSAEGDLLNTKSTMTQHAANQKVKNPAMPGVDVDLVKMSGAGGGDIIFDLTRLMPQGTIDFHSEMSMAVNMGGQKQPMDMKMGMKLALEKK